MNTAVIVDGVRSPLGRGRPNGLLAGLHPVDLLSQVFRGLLARNDLDPGIVDDVIVGCVSQVGEQSGGVGRMAWLAAGFPEHVPATTVERKCGSSQQALHFAAQGIMAGAYDVVIAGGVESMSRVPMGSGRIGMDPFGQGVSARYDPGLVAQGVSAELVAARWGLDREELDEYSVRSHRLADHAARRGAFEKELVRVDVPVASGDVQTVATDETIRPDTSVEALARLSPAFRDGTVGSRFPEIGWRITAGNSSQITDGAAAILVMSERKASELGVSARARFHAFSVVASDPVLMLTAPIPATRKILERARMNLDQIDHYEVNEAFAPIPLAWEQELHADPARLNPRGGAIALGHPLGASGARLMVTMLNGLEETSGRYGLQTMCEAGGMANATIIERL
jgi:acetyl-CoA acyltransferase